MRAPEDSSASTTRALTFSRARVELLLGGGLLAQPRELGADDLHRLAEVVRPRADVEADLARCRRTGRRTSRPSRRARAPRARPGTAATRTGRRRSRRARATAKRRSSPRGSPRAPRQTWHLLGVLALEAHGGRAARPAPARAPARRRRRAGRRACARPARRSASWSTEPGGGDHDRARHVAARRGRPRSASTGVSRITGARPMIGRPSGWSPKTASPRTSKTVSCGSSSYIAISSSTTSRSGSTSRNAGPPDHVGDHVERARQVLVEHPRVDRGALLVGAGVELGAHRVEQLVDLGRRVAVGALEQHVLEEVREPGLLVRSRRASRCPRRSPGPRTARRACAPSTTRSPLSAS